MKKRLVTALCATASMYLLTTAFVHAANVTVGSGTTVTTPQEVNNNEVGIVAAGGTIAVTGDDQWGLLANGDDITITNNGTITTSGNLSFLPPSGLYVNGNRITGTNNGSITTTGLDGIGIFAGGADSTVINNGSITTGGAGAHGMQGGLTGGSMTNNGTIVTTATNTRGIVFGGTNASLINNGSIVVTGGGSSAGMGISGDTNCTIINNGSITTTNTNNNGVNFNTGGGGTVFKNNGTITATGHGIFSNADNITVGNYGRINATSAIEIDGDNNTVIIGANSTTAGTIDFDGTGGALRYDLANRGGSVTTLPTAINGTHTTTTILSQGAKSVQSGNTMVVVTPDQFASTQQVITQTLTDAGVVVNNRQQLALLGETTELAEGRQYAASTASMNDATSPNDWALRNRTVAWAEGFGSYQERGENGDSSESTARSGGMMAGVDLPQSSSGYRVGFYVGGFAGNLDVGETSFREIDSAGGMTGGYIGQSFGDYYVSLGLGLGFSNNDSSRFTGVDTASADYTSYFASPSVTVMRPVKADMITWVPSVTVRYSAQYDDSYTETGSASANQTVDSRLTHALNGRAMVEAKVAPYDVFGGMLKPAVRAGVQGQTLLGDNNVDVRVLGSKLSFDPEGGNGFVDAVIGTSLNYEINQRLDVYFDGEANLGLNKGGVSENKGAVGRVGARWAF